MCVSLGQQIKQAKEELTGQNTLDRVRQRGQEEKENRGVLGPKADEVLKRVSFGLLGLLAVRKRGR